MDESNTLVEHCLAVVAGWTAAGYSTADDFTTVYSAVWAGRPDLKKSSYWYVGIYVQDHGKITSTGPTLDAALRTWLAEWADQF